MLASRRPCELQWPCLDGEAFGTKTSLMQFNDIGTLVLAVASNALVADLFCVRARAADFLLDNNCVSGQGGRHRNLGRLRRSNHCCSAHDEALCDRQEVRKLPLVGLRWRLSLSRTKRYGRISYHIWRLQSSSGCTTDELYEKEAARWKR